MNKQIQGLIAEDAKRLDEAYYTLGDVLDVKASIILVAVTFLGTLSGQVLSIKALPAAIEIFQVIAIATLCLVGVLVLYSLWNTDFRLPPKPNESGEWVVQLARHYRKQDDTSDVLDASIFQEFEKRRSELTLERILLNSSATDKKSRLVKWSFHLLSVAVAFEFACLIWLALWHL